MNVLKVTVIIHIVSFVFGVNEFHSWKSESGLEKPNLLCTNSCLPREADDYDRCCACEGKPIWQLDPSISYLPLFVEYVNTFGRSNIVGNDSSSFYWLVHENERMGRLPDNLCEFNNTLVTLKLKGNRIQSIEGINCLNVLDILDLSENPISSITNETFSGMPNLRVLLLVNTNIKTVGPNTFMKAGTEIFFTDLSNNNFESYDVSNVYFKRRAFCNITMASCNITFAKAEGILQPGVQYGGGEVVLNNSTLNQHPFQLLFGSSIESLRNINQYELIGKMTYEKLDIPCDCNFGALLFGDIEVFKRFYYLPIDGLYTCSSPEHLKNLNVLNVFNDSSLLDMFVCHKQNFCPSVCTCIEQPSRYRMIVDCSNQNLTSLPTYLPETIYNIELNCSNNAITEVMPVNYLRKLSVLDLSGNQVTEISDTVLSRLGNLESLYLTDHGLPKLTRGFADIDASKVWFGRNSVSCTCQEKWIKAWRLGSKVNSSNPLLCRTDSHGILRAEITFDNCIEKEFDRTFFTLLLIPATALVAIFIARVLRFDAIMLKSLFTKSKNVHYSYDVYVLFDDTNSDIIKYVLEIFRYLQHNGFECFVPPIHGDYADVRDVQL
ncbi:slit homolog 2 protein-like [Saccostrea cucullata]|uniref:slit homolog 2 protein-like n=1 Tax=Saccostrea cuccullata TaxID=36930 RepID=UPI002ED05863